MTLSLALVMIISVVSSNNHADQTASKDISRTPAEQTSSPASIVITSDIDTDKNMQISVTNQTENRIHFFCSVEREIDGRWRGVIGDATHKDITVCKPGIVIRQLEPHKKFQFVWSRNLYVNAGYQILTEGLFRIKVTLTTDKGAHIGQVVYSDPIEIKKI